MTTRHSQPTELCVSSNTSERSELSNWIGCSILLLLSSSVMLGDDPLGAMPTAKDSVANKVSGLTPVLRSHLELPTDEDVVVFSIAIREGKSKRLPWLTVNANGRIKVEMHVGDFTAKRDDKISKDELDWLMHLAVNECKGLERTTSRINANYKANRRSSNVNPQTYLYSVRTKDEQNTFEIPGEALTLRALRAELKLYPFASLHAFAKFVSHRAYLGNEAARKAVLELMNAELKAKEPDVPPFQLVHLLSAGESKIAKLNVMFQQQIPLGENKFKRVTGTYFQLVNKDEPTVFINSMRITKRPRPARPAKPK